MRYKQVYLDWLSHTPMPKDVFDELRDYFVERCGLPGALHQWGQWSKAALEHFIESTQEILGTKKPIRFSIGPVLPEISKPILLSPIESKKVKRAVAKSNVEVFEMKMKGFEFDLEQAEIMLQENDVELIIATAADMVTGTRQPVEKLAKLAKKHNAKLMVELSALIGREKFLFDNLGADLGFIDGLIIGAPCDLTIGTEPDQSFPLPLAAAFYKVIAHINDVLDNKINNLKKLEDYFVKLINLHLEGVERISGEKTVPGIVMLSFKGVPRGALSLAIDMQGIAVWAGDTFEGKIDELAAMGVKSEIAESAIRFTLWHDNTQDEIDYVLRVVPSIVERIRFETRKEP